MSVPPTPTAPAPQRGFQWWAPFAAFLAAAGVALVFVAILAGATGNAGDGDLPPWITLVASIIQDVLLIVAMVGVVWLTGVRPTPSSFGLRKVPIARAIGFAVLAFVVFYAFLWAWSHLQPDTKDDLAKDLGAEDSTASLVAVAVLVGIVAPIVEETFFRGFLFSALQSVMGWVPAALVAGLVFGGIHAAGTPIIFLAPLALLGFVLCALYRRTGSLLPGMGVHAFNNALALGVSLHWTPGQVVLGLIVAPLIVITLAASVSE